MIRKYKVLGEFIKSELEDNLKDALLLYLLCRLRKEGLYTDMKLECDDNEFGAPIIDDPELGPLLSTL